MSYEVWIKCRFYESYVYKMSLIWFVIFILKSVSEYRFSMGVELSKLKEIYKENA